MLVSKRQRAFVKERRQALLDHTFFNARYNRNKFLVQFILICW
jgi:hypothetical protein